MTPPHILLVNVFFAPFSYGGATVVAEQVARELVESGQMRVSAVSLISRAELSPYSILRTEVAGITNFLINMPQGRDITHNYDNPEVGRVLDDLIAYIHPDLMHLHCIQEVGIDALRAARRAKLPAILSVHDFWWICERQFMIRMDQSYCGQDPVRIEACKTCVPDFEASKTRRDALARAADTAEVVTYPSRFALELNEASGLAPGKGVVWENGVRLPAAGFSDRQAARRRDDPRLVFGFVGGPSQIKGWPTIRKAFQALGRSDFRVNIVEGSLDGGWWRGHDFSDLPGEWNVVPRYDQEGMDNFYSQIDVLLFMSQWKETFGLAIREALSRGISVIQTDSGGTTEHGAVAPEALIEIGAEPSVLTAQLEATLEDHKSGKAPGPATLTEIRGFAQQAEQFAGLVGRVLNRDGEQPDAP